MFCTLLIASLAACGGGGDSSPSVGLTAVVPLIAQVLPPPEAAAADAGSSAAMGGVPLTAAVGNIAGVAPTPIVSVASAVLPSVPAPDALTEIAYAPSSAIFSNPERGFYNGVSHCESVAFNLNVLTGYRLNDANTLVICVFYMANFRSAPLDAGTLEFFQRQMDTVRSAGLKAILRFAYTENTLGDDASPEQVAQHMDQLAPYFSRNSDVIYVMQSGFIGTWGEGAYSINFGMGGSLTVKNANDRKSVLNRLLQVMPASRMLQVRTPLIKSAMFGGAPLLGSEAFSGSARARIGHHNDCFLHGSADSGTYSNVAVEYPYLAAETTYLPMGGETCGLAPPRTNCASALAELEKFHWSYMNLNYATDVIDGWRAQGCYNQIKQSLGYRFQLQTASYSTSVKPGGTLRINLSIKNVGWAAPFNPRNVDLVLRSQRDGSTYRFRLDTDPRLWLAGQTALVSQNVKLPATMAEGAYSLLLGLPDPATSIAARPEYAIRFANDNMWEASTGLNSLNYKVQLAL